MHPGSRVRGSSSATGADRSKTPRSSSRATPSRGSAARVSVSHPEGAVRVDLSGKTVMPALIDGHNHNGLTNIRDGSNSKANYTRENLVDQLERCAYYGVGATLSMGLEADPEVAYRLRDEVIPNAARFLTVGKGIAATSMAGPPTEARLGIPYGAATEEEGRKDVQALHARGVKFVKIWVDDREGTVPKLKPNVYRAIIDEAHANGQQVLAHLGRTSALEDAKDLFRAGIDGFVHTVRDRDVDEEYLAMVKAHPNVWTGPNMPSLRDHGGRRRLIGRDRAGRPDRADASGDRAKEGFREHGAERAVPAPLPQSAEDPRCRHDDRVGDRRDRRRLRRPSAACFLCAVRDDARVRRSSPRRERTRRFSAWTRSGPSQRAGKPTSSCWTRTHWTTSSTRGASRVSTCRGKEVDRKALRARLTGANSTAEEFVSLAHRRWINSGG